MKKWAIFSDVDGTIYPFPSKELSEINQNKVKEVVSKGVEFVINTGNGPYKKIQKLAASLDGRYIICSNGALIFDNETKEILNIEYIPLTEAQKIWDLADEVGIGLYYFGTHQYYLKNPAKEFKEFITNFCEYNQWIETGIIPNDLHKIETYGTKEKMKEFYDKAIQRNIDLNIVLLDSHIEITKTGISKGSGVKWLCENILNTSIENVMSIGDSQNDISMFEITGYSYAMENTDSYSRKFAKYFTSTVEQNGLAEAIDDYLYRSDFELKRAISQGKIKK
ncbi:Cof-type HAD-IIB family hydrolase [Mycoplasmopsis felis]|uniref:Cof-type HAD-IIB family hydrolase n=1 Tax=Mycoplasmopsis felis TaxID=33923 RepID=UPI002AFED314|nr:Cof-type HAD-IIB family hydrolase [Mycoplasmopsis felis]WQQ07121.1 Cof-type HAD-IIB family hydrolase [Mycoplasmopsis felis]